MVRSDLGGRCRYLPRKGRFFEIQTYTNLSSFIERGTIFEIFDFIGGCQMKIIKIIPFLSFILLYDFSHDGNTLFT